MLTKKKIVWSIAGVIIFSIILLVIPVVNEYLEYREVVKATNAMPWQDGINKIVSAPLTKQGVCLLNLPPGCPATPPGPCVGCSACPLLSALLGPACQTYETEVGTLAQHGTTVLGIPNGFANIKGTYPFQEGMQLIAGGASNISPYVIASPSVAVNRIDKIVKWFNKYVIAAFKEK